MPTIEVSYKDLCKLIRKKISIEKLKEDILYAKGEIDEINKDILKIDIKDTNRPDLWSVEGIAREIRNRYNPRFIEYKIRKSSIVVLVDKKVKNVRPYTVCAVVRNLKFDDDALSQIIQLQEKVSGTFGRNRKEVAIGIYDLHKIKQPIRYTTVKPDEIKFVPLDFNEKMTPKEILEKHPKGKEFGHLLKDYEEYPIFIDNEKNVLSMPPIINSDYTGKVTKKTNDVFIECSGFSLKFLIPALNVIVAALAERNGKIYSVNVVYPDKTIITPDLKPKKFSVNIDYINKISGLNLTVKQICNLLKKAGYKTKTIGRNIELLYPAYRQDIMHQRDIVEDVLISYGYNNVEPNIPKLPTVGRGSKLEIFVNKITEILIGLGLQEILSYTLTNKNNLFEKMELEEEKVAEIENFVSTNWCVFRNWLLPSLLDFLAQNKHIDYPQKIFEIGNVVIIDESQETRTMDIKKLAIALSDNISNYEQISSYLDAIMRNLGLKYNLVKKEHPSFISGRCAEIKINNESIGIIGEIHPKVLNNWKLEKPVVAFEINLNKIIEIIG
ncbi:MAG: phenylalanine--tRNA ligase subunit beta [Candidatus Aenigmatarchaeota archaeon]